MALIGVISDIHSNLPALRAVLAELERLRVDTIINAGDLVGYYTFPDEVLEAARERGVVSIRGNHDRAVLSGDVSWFNEAAAEAIVWTRSQLRPDSMAALAGLPNRRRLRVGGLRVLVIHGSPRDDDEYVFPLPAGRWPFGELEADIVVMGHTHIPWTGRYGGMTVLNPGGVGQPRDGDARASFAMVDTDGPTVELLRTPYDIGETARAALKHGLPAALSARLYHGL